MFIAYWWLVITTASLARGLVASTAPRLSTIHEERRTQRPFIAHRHIAESPRTSCHHSGIEYLQTHSPHDYFLAFCNCIYCPIFAVLVLCDCCNCTPKPESYWKEKYQADMGEKVAKQAALGSSGEAK